MIPAHALAGIACMHLGRLASRDKESWLWFGIAFAFVSHAVIDALAIFTYHDASPSGSTFSQFVFGFGSAVQFPSFIGRFTTIEGMDLEF